MRSKGTTMEGGSTKTASQHPDVHAGRPASENSGRPARDGLLTSTQVCDLIGVSYRQLDYWVRSGIAYPFVHSRGSGHCRWWHPDQLPKLRAIAVVAALTAGPGRPSPLARSIAESPHVRGPWTLQGDGIRITIEEAP